MKELNEEKLKNQILTRYEIRTQESYYMILFSNRELHDLREFAKSKRALGKNRNIMVGGGKGGRGGEIRGNRSMSADALH